MLTKKRSCISLVPQAHYHEWLRHLRASVVKKGPNSSIFENFTRTPVVKVGSSKPPGDFSAGALAILVANLRSSDVIKLVKVTNYSKVRNKVSVRSEE
jgi:hypothetical protein